MAQVSKTELEKEIELVYWVINWNLVNTRYSSHKHEKSHERERVCKMSPRAFVKTELIIVRIVKPVYKLVMKQYDIKIHYYCF